MIIYLSHWYRSVDRAKAVATFMIAIPMSEIIGAPISALLMRIDWLGLAGWRWLLILEGLPAVLLGIVTLFYLTDRPQEAKWLPDDEREWITSELANEHHARGGHSLKFWRGLTDGRVLLLLCGYFALMNLSYAIVMWLPKILQATYGRSTTTTILLTSVPFIIGTPLILWIGWHSDRTRERPWHCAGPLLIGAAALLVFRAGNVPIGVASGLLALGVAGMQSAKGPFWALATTLLSGKAAAASVGLINSFGNLGGFLGPYAVGWLTHRSEGYSAGILYMVGSSVAAAALILLAGRLSRAAVPSAATPLGPAEPDRSSCAPHHKT
jgi:ACS family tartrate transporter-like MFS transporter